MSDRICIPHTNDADQDNVPVKAFTPETWEETASTAKKRRARPSGSKSKYRAICYDLPDSFSENSGYHSTCYKRFTSVPNSAIELSSQENENETTILLMSEAARHQQLPTTSSGVLLQICIFCNKKRKTKNRTEVPLVSCEYNSSEGNIKEAARILQDELMLAKIGSIGFHSKEVRNHNTCKREYLNKTRDGSESRRQ